MALPSAWLIKWYPSTHQHMLTTGISSHPSKPAAAFLTLSDREVPWQMSLEVLWPLPVADCALSCALNPFLVLSRWSSVPLLQLGVDGMYHWRSQGVFLYWTSIRSTCSENAETRLQSVYLWKTSTDFSLCFTVSCCCGTDNPCVTYEAAVF